MPLVEELKTVSGRKKRYLLLRIIGMDVGSSRQLCSLTKGTYNSWLQNDAFVTIHRRIAEFAAEYQREALQLLRRNNQQKAVLLEEKMLAKIDEELESGNYDLIKTNLGKEVYSKLIADLDYQPKALSLTWEQRVAQLNTGTQPSQIEQGGEVINAEFIETTSKSENQRPESLPTEESIQTSEQAQEEAGD